MKKIELGIKKFTSPSGELQPRGRKTVVPNLTPSGQGAGGKPKKSCSRIRGEEAADPSRK